MRKQAWTALGALALGIGSTQAGTILIDYDDGVAGGGHDAAVLNGGFESESGLAGDASFGDISDWLNMRGLESEQATIDTQVKTGARAALMNGNKTLYAVATGYTIQAGDSFAGSFDWRTAANSEVDDVVKVTLFYTADDTLPNNATEDDAGLVNLYSFTANHAAALNTYETAAWTSGVLGTGNAVGKKLMFRFESLGTSVPAPIEFGRVDNIYLEVLLQPSSLGLITSVGAGSSSFAARL